MTTGGCVSLEPGVTVNETGADVVCAFRLSVARAVRLRVPVVVGVQVMLYGLVASLPIGVVPSKNSTF